MSPFFVAVNLSIGAIERYARQLRHEGFAIRRGPVAAPGDVLLGADDEEVVAEGLSFAAARSTS